MKELDMDKILSCGKRMRCGRTCHTVVLLEYERSD